MKLILLADQIRVVTQVKRKPNLFSVVRRTETENGQSSQRRHSWREVTGKQVSR